MSLQLNTQTTATYLSCYPAAGMISTNSAQTMMYWINPSSVAVTSAQSTVGIYNGTNTGTGTSTAIQMGIRTATGNFVVWTWGGGVLVGSTGFTAVVNTWYHFAYTCNAISGGTQTHNLYINGVLNNTSTNALQIAGTPTMFYFNGYPGSIGGESNTSKIDDVYYFNRQLGVDEINTIYNTYGQRDGITYGLGARYNFNELPIGSTVVNCTDFSATGNTVTSTVASGGVVPTYSQDWAIEDTRPPL